MLFCNMREHLNKNVLSPLADTWRADLNFTSKSMVLSFLASYNEWYPLAEKLFQKQASCAGVDFRQPRYMTEGNILTMSFDFNFNPIEIGNYCEHDDYLATVDPRRLSD